MEPSNFHSKKDRLFPLSIFQQKRSGTEVAGLLETTNEGGEEKRDRS
jgi:hypothetical protein